MKHLISMVLFIALVAVNTTSADTVRDSDWNAFSKNLIWNIQNGNEGAKLSALQHVVHYGDSLQVAGAVYDVMRIYRNSQDVRTRQLALAALDRMNSGWAVGFLKRSLKFETSPVLKKQIAAIIKSHDSK